MPQSSRRLKFSPARREIICDRVHPRDFRELNLIYCCEQCSHFNPEDKSCTLGYVSYQHQREVQLRLYERSGRMAFCRYQEID